MSDSDTTVIKDNFLSFVLGSLTLGLTNPYLIRGYNKSEADKQLPIISIRFIVDPDKEQLRK